MGEVVRPLSPELGNRGRRALKVPPRAKLSLTPESKAHLPIHPTHRASRDHQSQSVSSLCPKPLYECHLTSCGHPRLSCYVV